MKEPDIQSDLDEQGAWDVKDVDDLKIGEAYFKQSQWGQVGSKTYKAFSSTHNKLPAGCYTVTRDNRDNSYFFMGREIKTDSIMRFKDDLVDKFLKEIESFWKKEKAFIEHGFLHKRGYLLYGNQGTGKSSIVWQIANDIIRRDGVVLVCENPKFLSEALKEFRQVEKKRPVLCVFEDIDAIISKYEESEILALLDGDRQVDRVINIATTNYPEQLDKRIVSRPRRFDRIYKILPPSQRIRTAFLTKKLPESVNKKEWIEKTDGLSFAALAETLISVLCLGNDLDETIKILREIETSSPSSAEFGGKVGFGATTEKIKERTNIDRGISKVPCMPSD